jgi:PAS domain S-box-containing protein
VDFLKGTVYSKALVIFLAAALGLLGAVVALSQFVILRELAGSERREMRAMAMRFSHAMSREARPLETGLEEWARLLSDKPDSAPSLLTLENLRHLNMDFAAVYDSTGRPFQVFVDPNVAAMLPPESAFFREMASHLEEGKTTGYAVLGDNLCLLAIRRFPDGARRSGGVLAGRIFGPGSWGFFEGLFSATVKFHLFENLDAGNSRGRHLLDLLATQEVIVNSDQDDEIVGYVLIKGINHLPLGYMSISQPRPLRQEGLRAIQVFLTGICLAGGGLVLVVWFLLDRTILARIKDLTEKLNAETRSGRLPVQLNFRGDDELGTLARGIEGLATLLQSTQLLYRTVVEDQTELICRFDADFRLSFANAIFRRLFRVPQGSPSPLLADLLPEEAWKEFTGQYALLSREKPLLSYTHEIRLPGDAAPVWFRSTLRRTYTPEGEGSGGQWVLADITAQVNAQRKMIESERRFRRLFESATDGLLLVEGGTMVVSDINPSLCRMLMVAGSEVLGRRLDQVPSFAPCVEAIKAFQRQGSERTWSMGRECRLPRGDETSVFVELRCGGYDVDGVAFVQLSFRNVSERVLGERELRRLSAKLLRLQDEERRRIARELHDSTAQNLSALEMNMSLLEPLVERTNPSAMRLVTETRQIASECSKELRNISYLLHPPLIDEVGLAFAIKWFADGFSKRTGIATHVEIEKEMPRLGSDLEMPLFRVVQEAMTNIYRHSGADHAWVRVRIHDRILSMEIRDNGRGFSEGALVREGAEKGGGLGVGLAGMKERLVNVGGTLEIESSPLGATLTIRVPLVLAEARKDDDTGERHRSGELGAPM